MSEDSEIKQKIRIIPPIPEVGKFLKEHPNPSWEETLLFLIDTFPQSEDRLEYLIEGGVAVHLLNPQRQTPDDVDFIYRNEEDSQKFSHLTGKGAKSWLYGHGLPESDGNADYLFSQFVPMEFKGRRIYLLNPVGLAFSKSVDYYRLKPRDKDLADLKLLGVTDVDIQAFREGFK